MSERHSAPHRGGHRRPPRRGDPRALIIGWAFLGVMLVLAVAAIAVLLPKRSAAPAETAPGPALSPAPVSSEFQTETTAPPLTLAEGTGGRAVNILGYKDDYTPPKEVVAGMLKGVDLLELAPIVAENVKAAGWGEITWTSSAGDLTLRAARQEPLAADGFERQEAFLQSDQPENLARTFLENSGLIGLLRGYGLSLSTRAENDNGMIIFRGTGDGPQTECSVRFSFLYTGAFNQAVIRAVFLDGAVTTEDVVPLKEAAKNAVTWSSAEAGGVYVIDVGLRPIRGIPFYVFTCQDGTVAYALAVKPSVLDQISGARAMYEEMMAEGIQEYTEVPGAGF